MEVRDAVERDAAAMAALTDAPEPVLRNTVHERSVRVLTEAPETDEDDDVVGFVSFDAREDAVFVTQFGGDRAACERLLAEPLRFARAEGLPVEVVLREDDDEMRAAAEAVGFEPVGAGPRFRGEPTRKYRHEP